MCRSPIDTLDIVSKVFIAYASESSFHITELLQRHRTSPRGLTFRCGCRLRHCLRQQLLPSVLRGNSRLPFMPCFVKISAEMDEFNRSYYMFPSHALATSLPTYHPKTSTTNSSTHSLRRRQTDPSLTTTASRRFRICSNMSGFLSSEAERALQGEEEEARRLFLQDSGAFPPTQHTGLPYLPSQHWAPEFNPASAGIPFQSSSHGLTATAHYSTEPWSNSSWSTLRPDAFDDGTSSQPSRSSSPGNPADLQNFGFPLSDGRSWRCAYPGCTSQAVFTRGCDLRKHFRRHTKSLFCRFEGCPQTAQPGFSSKKDRDRHEAKHAPGVSCEWEGCERLFSRVDNMKDHVRRIHRKKK